MASEWNRVGIEESEIQNYIADKVKMFDLFEKSLSLLDMKTLFNNLQSITSTQEAFDYISNSTLKYDIVACCLFEKTLDNRILLKNQEIASLTRYEKMVSKIYHAYRVNPDILKLLHLTNDSLFKQFNQYTVIGPIVKDFGELTQLKVKRMLTEMDTKLSDEKKSHIWTSHDNGERFEVFLRRDHRFEYGKKRKRTFMYKSALSAILRFYKDGSKVDIFAQTKGLNNALKEGISKKWLSKNQKLDEIIDPTSHEKLKKFIQDLFDPTSNIFQPRVIQIVLPELEDLTLSLKGSKTSISRAMVTLGEIGLNPFDRIGDIKMIELKIDNLGTTNLYMEEVN
jgi:hypothetical protein